MELLLALIVLGGGPIAAYFSDLREDVRILQSEGGLEAMERAEIDLAFAEIVALALLADGEVTTEEESTLREAAKTAASAGEIISVDDALERIAAVGRAAMTEPTLRKRVEILAKKLDAPRRAQAFALICALARGGSRMMGQTGYRGNAHGSAEALVDVFATALAIPEGERLALVKRYDANVV